MKLNRIVLPLLLLLCAGTGYAQTDSFSLHFQTGVTQLDGAQTKYLDSLLYVGRILPDASISITGYADEPGTTALNRSIAERRALSVRDYLVASGVDRARIIHCGGLGNLLQTGNDIGQRRVDIMMNWQEYKAATVPKVSITPPAPKHKRTLHDLGSMKPNELIVIENLLFKLSTNEFENISFPVLDELAEVLDQFPNLKVKFEGHVCCGTSDTGSNKLMLGYDLSVMRAQAVKEYLVKHGIASYRLSYAGFGFSRPKVYPERNQDDMYLNRRVEVRVMSNMKE